MPYYFRCPACGAELDRAVEKCPHCGAAFSGVVCSRCRHEGPTAAFRMGVCPKCGAPVRPKSFARGCLGTLVLAAAGTAIPALWLAWAAVWR